MNTFNDSLLSMVDRLTGSLGPVNALVDVLVDCLSLKATAKACGAGCFVGCSWGHPCYTGPCEGGLRTVSYMKTVGSEHQYPPYTCIPNCSSCGGDPCTVTESC